MSLIFILLVCLVCLPGCGPLADSSVTGTEKDIRVNVTINNSGTNGMVYFETPVSSASESATEQSDLAPVSTATPKLNLSLPGGIEGLMNSALTSKIQDVGAKFNPVLPALATPPASTTVTPAPVAPAAASPTTFEELP